METFGERLRRRVAKLYSDPRSGMTDMDYEVAMANLDAREALLVAAGNPGRDMGDIAAVLPRLGRLPPAECNAYLRRLIAAVRCDGQDARRVVWRPETVAAFVGGG